MKALSIEPTPTRSAVESSNDEQQPRRYDIFFSIFYFWKMSLKIPADFKSAALATRSQLV